MYSTNRNFIATSPLLEQLDWYEMAEIDLSVCVNTAVNLLLERTLAFWKDEMIGDADGLAEGTRTDSRGPRLTSFQFPPLKGSGKTQLMHLKSSAVTQSPSVESAQAQCSLHTHLEQACPDLAINLRLRHRRLPQTCYFSQMRHCLSLSHLSDRLLWEQQKCRSGRWAYSTCVDQYISKDQCSAGTCCNIRVRSSLNFFFCNIVKQNATSCK